MDSALKKYLLLPNRVKPDEFARYLTVHIENRTSVCGVKLTLPFNNTWLDTLHPYASKMGPSFLVWCREIGIIDADSPISENIDSIPSLTVWLMNSSSCYCIRDTNLKQIFTYLGQFDILVLLRCVCKWWKRIAETDAVAENAYRRVIWMWTGMNGDGKTEGCLWELDKRRQGLSYFSLTRMRMSCHQASKLKLLYGDIPPPHSPGLSEFFGFCNHDNKVPRNKIVILSAHDSRIPYQLLSTISLVLPLSARKPDLEARSRGEQFMSILIYPFADNAARIRCQTRRHECRVNQATPAVSFVERIEQRPADGFSLHVVGDDRLSFVLMQTGSLSLSRVPTDPILQLYRQSMACMWVVTFTAAKDRLREQIIALSLLWLRSTSLSTPAGIPPISASDCTEAVHRDPSMVMVMLYIDTSLLPTAAIYASESIQTHCQTTLELLREILPPWQWDHLYIQPFSFGDNTDPAQMSYPVQSMKFGVMAGVNIMIRRLRD